MEEWPHPKRVALRSWSRNDRQVQWTVGPGRNGPPWGWVLRRLVYNSETGDMILDEDVHKHSVIRQRLPNCTDTTTIFLFRVPGSEDDQAHDFMSPVVVDPSIRDHGPRQESSLGGSTGTGGVIPVAKSAGGPFDRQRQLSDRRECAGERRWTSGRPGGDVRVEPRRDTQAFEVENTHCGAADGCRWSSGSIGAGAYPSKTGSSIDELNRDHRRGRDPNRPRLAGSAGPRVWIGERR